MRAIATAGHHLLGLAFPGRCPGCGRPAEPVCAACWGTVRPAPAAPPPAGVDEWVAGFAYEGVGRELIARAKYRGRHAGLRFLAAVMVEAWVGAGGGRPDHVTWVPTAPARRRARGVDHARVLAREVGYGLGRRAVALLDRDDGPAQTERSAAARRHGPVVHARRAASGTVLLVDDVATSGASLRVCAGVLRGAGAQRVVAVTAARTPPVRSRC